MLIYCGGNPAFCSPSGSTSCSSPSSIQTIGTNNGSNGQYSYPGPFAHYRKNGKQQYLFRASEFKLLVLLVEKLLKLRGKLFQKWSNK